MNSKYQGSEYSENGDGDEDFVENPTMKVMIER